jgi:hypothetical protein
MLPRYLREIRWLLVGLAIALGALYFLSFYLVETRTLWSFLGIALSLIAGIALTLVALAPDIAALYGVSERAAIRSMLRTIFGLSNGIHIIENGRTTTPSDVDEASISGPRSVHIRCSAAVFYRGSRHTHISGPGVIDSGRWEYVRHIVDLRPSQETLTYDHVLTDEHLPTSVELSATYGIAVSPKTVRGETPLTPSEQRMILRICTDMPEWKRVVQEEIGRSLRQAVADYRLDDLLKSNSIEALSRQVQSKSNTRLNPYGLRVSRVSVLSVQPDDNLLQAANQAKIDLIKTQIHAETTK